MALYDRTAAQTHLGIGATEATFLDQVGPQCEAALLAYIKRPVEQTTYTEYHSGTGTPALFLRRTPVQSITTIHERSDLYYGDGDAATSDDLLTAGTDYTLDRDQETTGSSIKSKSGVVFRIGGVWPRPSARAANLLAAAPGHGLGNIKVVYVAGWPAASIPTDIKLALHQMIAIIRKTAQDGGSVQSESLDYWSQTQFAPDMVAKAIGSVTFLLKPYKQLVL